MKRTHYCGGLRLADVGEKVVLMGWAQRTRDHGGVIFVDLRDRTGITQVVFDPADGNPNAHQQAHRVRSEFVLAVQGTVRPRPEGTVNPELPTGEIEIMISEIEILNVAQTPTFAIEDDADISEEIRLKYRYLDLRRPKMQQKLMVRHKAALAVRQYMDEHGFLEIETPVIANSTPEGARDFLIPSRLNAGKFYALPQSPQQFKQLLMMSGVDRYFQIVRCYRDEDLRADRQLEFTQIDVEMSFADQEDVFEVIEGLTERIFAVVDRDLSLPFPRMTHAEAMERYGSDKPDTRFGMELVDVSDIAGSGEFNVFNSVLAKQGKVRGLVAPGCAGFSRKQLDDLTEFVRIYRAKGLAWMKVTDSGVESPIAKFFTDETLTQLITRMQAEPGDLMLFVADQPKVVSDSLAQLRLILGEQLGLVDHDRYDFVWIVDFPLFHWDEEAGRFASEHHPFTAPHPDDTALLDEDPGKVRSQSYDLVLNGNEIFSGSVRLHQWDIQQKVFEVLKLKPEQIKARFGYFIDALQYGTPPHAGIAGGFDRIVMLMTGDDNIREIIAFPKTQKGTCLVTGAPSEASEQQLKELHIRVVGN